MKLEVDFFFFFKKVTNIRKIFNHRNVSLQELVIILLKQVGENM